MKRAQPEEEKCRRTEFKCRLYDIIKELDRSLKSECGYSKPSSDGQRTGAARYNGYTGNEKKRKGSECCCPPGCCKESLEVRMPRLLPKEEEYGSGKESTYDPDGTGTGHLGWHNEDHSWGCRPVGEGGPGSQSGGARSSDINSRGGGPTSDYGAKCGGVGGGPSPGSGCCAYYPNPTPSPRSAPDAFQFPQSPEEAIQRGCFVALSS